MRVSAAIDREYMFLPKYGEWGNFKKTFLKYLVQSGAGYTLMGYEQFDTYIIKGNTYLQVKADITRSFDNRQQLFHYLKSGLTLDSYGGTVTNGIKKPINFSVTVNEGLGVVANHMPTIYQLVGDGVVIESFDGNYDMGSGQFRGQMRFKKLSELWN